MKKLFVSVMNILNYLPVMFVLGIITGFGAHTALFGALIASVIAFVLRVRGFYSISILSAIYLGAANVFLGGRCETLWAMLFVCGIILIFASFLNFQKFSKKIKKFLILSGLIDAVSLVCAICAICLSIPLILGEKTFSAVFLIPGSGANIFWDVNEFAIIIFMSITAIYYYLKRLKNLPVEFIAFLTGVLINYFYQMNLPCIIAGFENYKLPAAADFGKITLLILFGGFLGLLIIFQELLFFPCKKNILTAGLADCIGAITGSIAGGRVFFEKKYKPEIEAIILLIFTVFYFKIANYIPIAACASILIIKCIETSAKNIKSIWFNIHKNLPFKKFKGQV